MRSFFYLLIPLNLPILIALHYQVINLFQNEKNADCSLTICWS